MKSNSPTLHCSNCSTLQQFAACLINTKCDGTAPRPRAAVEGEHSAALKQNQIVEDLGGITQPAPGLHGSHPSV